VITCAASTSRERAAAAPSPVLVTSTKREALGMTTPNLMTTEQVAEYLQVSTQWVYKRAQSGVMPALRLTPRGDWRFRRTDLDTWLEQKRNTA
jgi:excisionase family DNA binding protein